MSGNLPSPSFADDRLVAHTRAAHLAGLPWPERLRSVREDRSFSEPDFIELALSLSAATGMSPGEREEWARLAVEAALHGGSSRVEELEPLAWAHLGCAYRLRDRLWAGRSAILRCAALRHRLGTPRELAEALALEASYWCEVEDLDKAAALIGEALQLATRHADDEQIATYQIRAGIIAADGMRWSTAIENYLSALDRIDPGVHPRLALIAGHNLANASIGIGHLDTAMCAILSLSANYERFAEPKIRLLRDILVSEIACARGHWREAEIRLNAIRQGFIVLGLPTAVAYVDLALAKIALRKGQWSAAALFAAKAARAYSSAGSPHKAAEAHRLFRRARAKCRDSDQSGKLSIEQTS
jgi:tetratricopeptide (TPR) repeat protein